MGVSAVVVQLAEAIAVARRPLSPREECWLHLLRGMPFYLGIGRLDLWEAACNAVAPTSAASITEHLLEEVHMLGLCNLYQAFNEPRTRECYRRLVPFFAERGVVIPTAPDLSGW